MLPLPKLQTAFRLALLGGDAGARSAFRALVDAGDPAAEERIEVYRNNVFASLTDVLEETFPVICRLVDERFFSYAAHEFILAHPPDRPCLSEYGSGFADFLESFPPCRELPSRSDRSVRAVPCGSTRAAPPRIEQGSAPPDDGSCRER